MKFKNKEELSKAYDELEKAYTKECQENKKLREQLKLVESEQTKIWQPKEGEIYWTVINDGEVWRKPYDSDSNNDKMRIYYGNYFKTKEEAEKQAEYNCIMNRFRKYVQTFSEPIVWDNRSQYKYYLLLRAHNRTIEACLTNEFYDAFQIYASSEQILKDAINYSAGSEEEFIRIVFGD